MSNHAVKKPEIAVVMKGDKYSRSCGAESRHQASAPFDGIAVDGHLYSVDEWRSYLHTLDAERSRRESVTIAEMLAVRGESEGEP